MFRMVREKHADETYLGHILHDGGERRTQFGAVALNTRYLFQRPGALERVKERGIQKMCFQCRDCSFVRRALKQRIIIKNAQILSTRKCTDTNKSAIRGLKYEADMKARKKEDWQLRMQSCGQWRAHFGIAATSSSLL